MYSLVHQKLHFYETLHLTQWADHRLLLTIERSILGFHSVDLLQPNLNKTRIEWWNFEKKIIGFRKKLFSYLLIRHQWLWSHTLFHLKHIISECKDQLTITDELISVYFEHVCNRERKKHTCFDKFFSIILWPLIWWWNRTLSR